MNRRSWVVILSLVALLSLFVAACGDDEDEDGGVTIVDEETATSPSAGGPPTATAGAGGEGTAPAGGEGTAPAGGGEDGDLAAMGEELYASLGCQGCHSLDGSVLVGPSFQGLFGHEVTLASGDTVTADEAYIEESIRDPSAKVVEGFNDGIMPTTFADLSDDDIAALIAFIKAQSE